MKYLILLYLTITLLIPSNSKSCPEHSTLKKCVGCPLKWGLKGTCQKACNPGCVCDEGYVQSQDNATCVLESESPEGIVCPNNLLHSNKDFRATCGNSNSGNATFGPVCKCPKKQYYYSEEKVCVEAKYCPESAENLNCRKSYPNSEYVACTCIKTCAVKEPKYDQSCKPGCQCLEGFVWHVDKCVPTETCP